MANEPMANTQPSINFGRVLKEGSAGVSETRTWLYVLPALAVVVFLVVFSFSAISRASGLASQVKRAGGALEEARKAVDERDKLLTAARADELVTKTPGQAAVVMTAGPAGGNASGVVLVHPDQHALAIHLFGLPPASQGQQYRVYASTKGGEPKQVASFDTVDQAGRAFAIARNVPDGPLQLTVAMAPATGDQPAASPPTAVLSASLPGVNEASGVLMAKASVEVPTQSKASARPRRAQGRAQGRSARGSPGAAQAPGPAALPEDISPGGSGLSLPGGQ